MSDAWTKSLSRPAFEKHREFMVGTRVTFSTFCAGVINVAEPVKDYILKIPDNRQSVYCQGLSQKLY